MKNTSASTGRVLKLSTLILSLVALATAGGMGCAGNRYNQSTDGRSDNDANSSRVREGDLQADTQNAVASGTSRRRDMGLQTSPTSSVFSSPNGSMNF